MPCRTFAGGPRVAIRAAPFSSDWFEAMRIAAQLRADGVELEIPQEYGPSPLFDTSYRRRLREASERSARVLSVRLEALERYSFCAREDRLRAEAELLAIDAVDACSELGAPVLVLPLLAGRSGMGQDPRRLWAASLNSVSYAAEDKHVTLAVEPRGSPFAPDAAAALEIIGESGSKAAALAVGAAAALGLIPGSPVAVVYADAGPPDAPVELVRRGWSGLVVFSSPDPLQAFLERCAIGA